MPDLSPAAHVAALKVLSERVAQEYKTARATAQAAFREMRTRAGVRSLDVTLPSGESVGTISITGATRTLTWEEPALLAYVERNAPSEVVTTIDAAAVEDPEIVDLIARHRPDLIRRSVRPAYRELIDDQLAPDGTLTDPITGEVVRLATVATTPPTGAFTFRKSTTAEQAVLDAWHTGDLSGVGASLMPELQPAPATPAGPAAPFPAPGPDSGPFPTS